MKNINTIGIFLVILLGNNQSFGATGEMQPIPEQEQPILENNQSFGATGELEALSNEMEIINNPLYRKLRTFQSENPQFGYGLKAIDYLYDQGIKIDDLYESDESSPLLRRSIHVLSVLAEGACGTVQALSIFTPDSKILGQVLLGCYIVRTALGTTYNELDRFEKPTKLLFNALNRVSADSVFQVSEAINRVNEVDIRGLLNLSRKLTEEIKSEELSEEEQLKFARLETLIKKLDEKPKIRKRIMLFCKTIAILINSAACVSITNTGQKSKSSYWLTLFNSCIDPMYRYVNGPSNLERSHFKRYLRISEMLYICNGFINGWEPLSMEA